MKDWELYERLVARLMANQVSTDFCVTPNASILGAITGTKRQIDVLIDARHDTDNTRRIIVDAKRWNRKIDVKDVESFLGMMQDVGATHGYLICPLGYSPAAEMRAQSEVSLRLLPLNHLEDFDPRTWPRCMRAKCKNGRVFWDGYPEISLEVSAADGTRTRDSFVHLVGKCDRCRIFHVSCLTCRQILCIPENNDSDSGHQCACRLPLFWIASIEEDEGGAKSAELHFVTLTGRIQTVNRKSLSAA